MCLCLSKPRGCNMYLCSIIMSCLSVELLHMCKYQRMCLCLSIQCMSEFGHWVCGESWHATKDFNPLPQF